MRSFENVLERLQSGVEPDEYDFPALSDLNPQQFGELKKTLLGMKDEEIISFFESISEFTDSDFTVNYPSLGKFGLDHDLAGVRAAAVHLLRFTDDRKTAAQIMEMAEQDPDEEAAAAAVKLLGTWVYQDDMEEDIPVSGKKLAAVMERLAADSRKKVRLAAMCGMAYTDSALSKEMIETAFRSSDPEELRAALIAAAHSMSYDYAQDVMKYLCSDIKSIRMEAIFAAGQIQMRQALPELYAILKDFETEDGDILYEAIRSIAGIGDESSGEVLEALAEAVEDEDEVLCSYVEECMEDLEMTCKLNSGHFFDFDPDFEEEDEEFEGEDFDEDDEDFDDFDNPQKEVLPEGFEERLAEAQDDVIIFLDKHVPVHADDDDDDDECGCGEHHHHEDDKPDISKMHIIEDLEAYEKGEDLEE